MACSIHIFLKRIDLGGGAKRLQVLLFSWEGEVKCVYGRLVEFRAAGRGVGVTSEVQWTAQLQVLNLPSGL